jgi:hypothetical protein
MPLGAWALRSSSQTDRQHHPTDRVDDRIGPTELDVMAGARPTMLSPRLDPAQ